MTRRHFFARTCGVLLASMLPLPQRTPQGRFIRFKNLPIDPACYANRIYFLNARNFTLAQLSRKASALTHTDGLVEWGWHVRLR